MSRLSPWIAFASLAVLLAAESFAVGQEPAQPTDERAAHLARMKALASSFEIFAAPDQPQSRVELAVDPVFRYSDNTRKTHESTLWIWGAKGRPTAVMAIEFYPDFEGGPRLLYEVASLATERIAAERGDQWSWTAKAPGLHLQPFPDAEPPAPRPARRLVQMKALRNRFAAHEQASIEGRIELRPLASPLHRYDDAERGVVDGAIFSFANGTNPEVLLVLEAHQSDGKRNWLYALARLTGEPLTVQLDAKDVWEREAATPPATLDNYANGWLASDEPTK